MISLRKIYRTVIPNIYLSQLVADIKGSKTVLDLGCGFKSPIKELPKTFYSVGVDMHRPYILESKKKKLHDKYFVMDIMDASKKFKPKSFDSVIALGVIEHLTKKEGLKLLDIMERLARKKIIIFTPSGLLKSAYHYHQVGYDHKSGWIAKDFEKLGYNVYGVNGLKWLKHEDTDPSYNTQIRFRPIFFWKFVSDISALFLKNNPEKSFEILAVKTFPDESRL